MVDGVISITVRGPPLLSVPCNKKGDSDKNTRTPPSRPAAAVGLLAEGIIPLKAQLKSCIDYKIVYLCAEMFDV